MPIRELKTFLVLTVLLAPMISSAGEVLVDGGRSPSGRYEVKLKGDEVCEISIIDTKTGKVMRNSPLGYGKFEGLKNPLYTHALWNSDESLVAIRMIETKRTSLVEILWVHDGEITSVPLPNYLQNILGRLNSVSARGVQQKLSVWDNHNLKLRVGVSTEETSEDASFDVNLRVLVGKGAVPTSILQMVTLAHE